MVYLFAPNYGETIYGTKTILLQGYGRFYLTSQELFYLFNLALKYFCTVPLAVLFLMTTQPSQFASSLNQIGVSYKVAYAVSLTLRYIPNVQEEFYMIRMSQEARGLELSQKEKLMKRIKGNLQNCHSLDFQPHLSELIRCQQPWSYVVGKNKKAYLVHLSKIQQQADLLTIVVAILLVIISLWLFHLNQGRFTILGIKKRITQNN